jgi:hypothetical protein
LTNVLVQAKAKLSKGEGVACNDVDADVDVDVVVDVDFDINARKVLQLDDDSWTAPMVPRRTSSGRVTSIARRLLEAEVHRLRALWSEGLVKVTYADVRHRFML